MTLDELRQRLDALDAQVLDTVVERQNTIREIARVKHAAGFPVRDYAREGQVILLARANATRRGLSPDLAEALVRLLIRYSLTTQEQATVAAHGAGGGRSALVIGGAGKMGGWFAHFLRSQGFEVQVADPAASGADSISDWRQSELKQDVIVVATPLGATNAVLHELAARAPSGLVFDLGSLKSPLRSGLEALRAAGVRVSSVHPMFGPDTQLLSGRHVIFIDLGVAEPLAAARALFAPTMAEQTTMGLDEHDHVIAYVLGLSHALNIAFFTALADSGEGGGRLAQVSSTTFDAQFSVARQVAEESADLYFEIQHLNDFGSDSLDALARAVDTVREAVRKGDRDKFRALMHRGRDYILDRRSTPRS